MFQDSIRLDYSACRRVLRSRLAERSARIQLLTGPRQVGKTTLLLELAREIGEQAIYAAADGPEATLPGFWERLWAQVGESVAQRKGGVLLLDEAHVIPDWAGRLKGEWDRLRRRGDRVHVVATGSSALRLATGSRESLAGRFERLTLAHWSPRALADAFGVSAEEATDAFVRFGSYPGAFELRADPARWRAYLRDAIVEPAIGRDLLALRAIRRPALLRQVFAVCATSPAAIVSLEKIQGQLHDRGALETIAHYLELLEEAYLVAPLAKHSSQPRRRRAAPPKLVTLNNALLGATDPRGIPDPSTEPARFGAWIENACLAFAWNSGQAVSYWREEPLDVDGVIDGSWGAWAIEVKTSRFTAMDLRGLFEFSRRYPRFRPLVLCDERDVRIAADAGARAIPWRKFLLGGSLPENPVAGVSGG